MPTSLNPIDPMPSAPEIGAPRPVVGFILGTVHSGSTWLNLVLGGLDGAAALGEFGRSFSDVSRVNCRLCEAEGLEGCEQLDGVEALDPADAFRLVFRRTGARALIDSTKDADWIRRAAEDGGVEPRLIHLVRHPCGFADSLMRRRTNVSFDQAIGLWERWNDAAASAIADSGYPAMSVCYDALTASPTQTFPALCDFLGLKWNPGALRYWTRRHHGIVGGGAAALCLQQHSLPGPFVTGDDAYYRRLAGGRTIRDQRWRTRLIPEQVARAMRRPLVQSTRDALGADVWDEPAMHQGAGKPGSGGAPYPSSGDLQWALVSGPPRSGTTLLANMLNAHPACCITLEYGLDRLIERIAAIVDRSTGTRAPAWAPAYLKSSHGEDGELADLARYYADRADRNATVENSPSGPAPKDFEPIARAIFESIKGAAGLKVVGDKLPLTEPWTDLDYVEDRVGPLKAAATLRNPLGFVNSSKVRAERAKVDWGEWRFQTIESAIAAYGAAMDMLVELRARFDKDVVFVKYEDLCASPTSKINEIYAHFGLGPHDPGVDTETMPVELGLLRDEEFALVHERFKPLIDAWSTLSCDALLDLHAGAPTG